MLNNLIKTGKDREREQVAADIAELVGMRGFKHIIAKLQNDKLVILGNLNARGVTSVDNEKDIGRLLQIETMLAFFEEKRKK